MVDKGVATEEKYIIEGPNGGGKGVGRGRCAQGKAGPAWGAVPRPNNRSVSASYVPHVANVPCTG